VDLYLGNTFFVVFWRYWIYDNNYIANPDGLKPLAASIKFITGYLIELSLSVDNIFVIAIIFRPSKYRKNTSIRFYFGYSQGNRIQRLDDLLALCLSINFSGNLPLWFLPRFHGNENAVYYQMKFEPKKSFVLKS
jgi:tellurite resistance protein TerC